MSPKKCVITKKNRNRSRGSKSLGLLASSRRLAVSLAGPRRLAGSQLQSGAALGANCFAGGLTA
jgi:hypothetical protein